MKFFTVLYAVFLLNFTANAQVSINSDGTAPSSTSMLDVQSTNRGVKFPRMTTAQRKAITVTVADAGLMLYDTDQAVLYMYDGEQWIPFAMASGKQPRMKEKFATGISNNARMGASTSMSNEFAAVGCPNDSSNGVYNAGSVLIYKKVNNSWVEQAKVTSPESNNEYFGHSVSILGNVLAVGAINARVAGIAQGAVYIFINNNGIWTFQQKLYANDGASGSYFGCSVLLHQNSLYIGSMYHTVSISGQGSVYVFDKSGNSFVPLTRINGTEAGANDAFGMSLAGHNNTIVVGAPYDDNDTKTDEGSVYVFLRSGNIFSQQAKLKPAYGGGAGIYFGKSVAIFNDVLLTGAPYVYLTQGVNSGMVYYFKRTGTAWAFGFNIKPGVTENYEKGFGASIIMTSAKDFVVGAPFESVDGIIHKGAAYVFRFNDSGTGEIFRYRYFNNDMVPYTGTGLSLASNGTDLLIGSPGSTSVSKMGSIFFATME